MNLEKSIIIKGNDNWTKVIRPNGELIVMGYIPDEMICIYQNWNNFLNERKTTMEFNMDSLVGNLPKAATPTIIKETKGTVMNAIERMRLAKQATNPVNNPINPSPINLLSEKVELSIQKFAEVEKLRSEITAMRNDLNTMTKAISEVQASLLYFAKTQEQIKEHLFKKASTPVNPSIPAASPVNPSIPVEKPILKKGDERLLYESFMRHFGKNFNGSSNADQLEAFRKFIGKVDFTDEKTINATSRKAITYTNDQGEMKFYIALKSIGKAIPALVQAMNETGYNGKSIAVETTPSTVKNKEYWIAYFGISEDLLKSAIDFVKYNGLTNEVGNGIIAGFQEEKALNLTQESMKDFFAWLKAFKA